MRNSRVSDEKPEPCTPKKSLKHSELFRVASGNDWDPQSEIVLSSRKIRTTMQGSKSIAHKDSSFAPPKIYKDADEKMPNSSGSLSK